MTTLHLKRRDVQFEVKSLDDKTGEFSGYGSVFGVIDTYRDVVQPGAFKASLERWSAKSKLPSMLWQHQMAEPIGVWTKMQEDDKGLYAEGRILLDAGEMEKRAYAHLKAGSVSGLSIGYYLPAGGGEYDPKADVYKLKEIDLIELSVVTAPANEEAQVDAVKAALESPREFERLLRDAGFSRTQAKALMSGGYKALTSQRDADDDERAAGLAKAIAQFTETILAASRR
jgi:HK97 family phage prohead protease